MSEPCAFCTICTDTCHNELIGLLLSLSVHHTGARVDCMVDSKTREAVERVTPRIRLDMHFYVELDKYSGMTRGMMTNSMWTEFQMCKSKVIIKSLESSPDTLFLDSDIIVFDKIVVDKTKDLGVSPQFIRQHNVDETGYYNGGVLWCRNVSVPKDWIEYTKTSRYFDQASIEDLAKKYEHFEFGEEYNLQAWRMYLGLHDVREKINKRKNGIYYGDKKLKFIHTHFHDKRFHEFNQLIIGHLYKCRRWRELAIIYRVINREWILKIPQQPMHGLGNHADDSFRELAGLIAEKHDVSISRTSSSRHCYVSPNILLYDRPTLEWYDNDVPSCSLFLLGNGSTETEGRELLKRHKGMNIRPWIFWPRRPSILEDLLTKGVLSYEQRDIETVFIGNYENPVQERFRTGGGWSDHVQYFRCTAGQKHIFTQEEYLGKLRASRYGLSLRGYGSKCHREVELMAFGTVPIVTEEVTMDSYMDPPKQGVHYLVVSKPEDIPKVMVDAESWGEMSKACHEWYMRNVHSDNCWNMMMENIIYD